MGKCTDQIEKKWVRKAQQMLSASHIIKDDGRMYGINISYLGNNSNSLLFTGTRLHLENVKQELLDLYMNLSFDLYIYICFLLL